MLKLFLKARDYGRIMNLILLLLRLTIAGFMLMHSVPKLMRMLSGNFQFADPIGLGQTLSLILTVFAEFLCSVVIAVGLGTRLATIPLIITMLVILFIVHGNQPVISHYDVVLYTVGYFILLFTGSGKYSLEYYLQRKKR
jgi:putative oxidoreductase